MASNGGDKTPSMVSDAGDNDFEMMEPEDEGLLFEEDGVEEVEVEVEDEPEHGAVARTKKGRLSKIKSASERVRAVSTAGMPEMGFIR